MAASRDEHGHARKLATFVLRSGGLLASSWWLGGLFADAYVVADRRWIPGLVDGVALPIWLPVLWCWPATRRPGWFFVAGVTAALLIALRFGARYYAVDPDIGREQARATGFWSTMIAATIAVALAFGVVWLIHKRQCRGERTD